MSADGGVLGTISCWRDTQAGRNRGTAWCGTSLEGQFVMDEQRQDEWLRADPGMRRRAIVFLAVLAIAAVVAFLALEQWLAGLQASDPALAIGTMRHVLRWTFAAMTASLVLFAAYLWLLGRRILVAEQYPPPGMKVVRDTLVVRGEPARRRGRMAQGLAIVLLIAAVAVVVFMSWRILPNH